MNIQTKRNIPMMSTSISNKHPRDYRFRSSHQRCSRRKGVLRNFAKFTGNCLRPAAFLKKRPLHRCFPVNFAKFLRTPFLQSTINELVTFSKTLKFMQTIVYQINTGWLKTQIIVHMSTQVTGRNKGYKLIMYFREELTWDLCSGDLGWELPIRNATWVSDHVVTWGFMTN